MSRIENALDKASRIRAVEDAGTRPFVPSNNDKDAAKRLDLPKNPYLVAVTAPDSPAAEEYRKLKSMVIKLMKKDAMQNIIMMTSCTSGEGKSLTSINLAVCLAQDVSHRALLIDADLRRPSLCRYLGIDAKVGLSDCLLDGVSPSSAIIGTGIPKLDILPAGKSVGNPVEVLSSPKLKALLGELKRYYPEQYIIIDTPPVLPFAETQVISMLADGVLVVVKEGESTVQDIHDALEIMHGTRLLGIVFNETTTGGMSNRFRHYYRYYAAEQRREA
jgi:protein-tyrosine kinase